ncbi:MAG: sialidase family protein, partial [Bryobacteraceae bacterium]
AALARIRTASAGDPVIAWDGHGRVFLGSESSEDPAGSKKTFGDVWVARFENPGGETGNTLNDGKFFKGSAIVASGSSAPNLLGKFHDKTAIEADRTGGACDGNVYFSWTRFTGIGISNIYFSRSTDHGVTWSAPMLLTQNISNVQDPDISVTGNGHVYVTFDMGATNSGQPNGVGIAKSSDCGRSFAKPRVAVTYTSYEAHDISAQRPPAPSAPDDAESGEEAAGSSARDCGDFQNSCQSGYTFFRHGTSTRSTADQSDAAHEWIYIVYGASKPGTEVATGTTFGSIRSGTGSQSGAYFMRYDGAAGTAASPALIEDVTMGHQIFPDISADGGVLHAIWWDSRNDKSYSAARPVGNDASGATGKALDVYGAKSTNGGISWTAPVKLNTVPSNPNFEQFSDRTVPFGGDYLWVSSIGSFAYGTWTDWRNTVPGTDPREPGSADGADVKQCRTLNAATGLWSSDQCPHDGGIDQDIYGAVAP